MKYNLIDITFIFLNKSVIKCFDMRYCIDNMNINICPNIWKYYDNIGKQFKRIDASNSKIEDKHIDKMQNIEELNISDCPNFTGDNFSKLKSLKTLIAKKCNYTHYQENVIDNIKIKVQDDLNISLSLLFDHNYKGKISIISEYYFLNLRYRLQHSAISQIRDDVFKHLKNLTELDISECDKADITDNAFKGMTNLKRLNISKCTQKFLSSDMFNDLSSLTYLDISLCESNIINKNSFDKLQNLKTLKLCGRLSIICPQYFEKLNNLIELDISGCGVVKLDDIFQYTPKLKKLSIIKSNSIKKLTNGFDNLIELEILNASYFNASNVLNIFDKISNLTELDISNSTLNLSNNDMFKNMKKLKILNISGCKQFYDKLFDHLHSLTSLNMEACFQDILTNKMFENLTNLTELNMKYCWQNTFDDNIFYQNTKIIDLNISGTNLSIDALKPLDNLKKVNISRCMKFKSKDVTQLKQKGINVRI